MEKSSKYITYILIAVCVALPFLIALLSRIIANVSADKNGHGIDGVGAAMLTGAFIKIFQIVGYIAYLALWIYSIVRVFKLGMPKWVIVLPLIPIVLALILNIANSAKINKAKKAFTAESYISEVLERKKKYTQVTADGDEAVYVYGYVLTEVVSDLWMQKLKYNMDRQERKAIVDPAIPELMKDLESETLCYEKMWAPDGTKDGKFYKTTMEYWNYDPDKDTLTIKLSHKDEPDVFVNKWPDAEE